MPDFQFSMDMEPGEFGKSVDIECNGDRVDIWQKHEWASHPNDHDLITISFNDLKQLYHLLGEALGGLE